MHRDLQKVCHLGIILEVDVESNIDGVREDSGLEGDFLSLESLHTQLAVQL